MKLKSILVQNLKNYRKCRGFSQMTLAEMCGTSTSYIGQIEIGNRFPSLDMIEKIAKALKVKPYLLFVDGLETESTEKPLPVKKDTIPSAVKDKLVKRLNVAIQRVVKQLS